LIVDDLEQALRTDINGDGTIGAPAISYTCSGSQRKIFDNWNGDPVAGNGTPPSFSTGGKVYCVVAMATYHWNGGKGAPEGTIGLESAGSSARTLGPWQAHDDGYGSPNVNWVATPASGQPVVINGDYSCSDSDRATWSQNGASGGNGFCWVLVTDAVRT
jgi:hypothetical protein